MSTTRKLLNTTSEVALQSALSIVDSVIVGAGPAGLSCGLFLGRSGRSVIAFDGGASRITVVDRVREFIGFDGMKPQDMLERMRNEAIRYGVRIQQQRVEKIIPRSDGFFDVHTKQSLTTSSPEVTARTIILACGLVDQLPAISGIQDKWGNDLRVCPCFDGCEVINQKFVVFGGDAPHRLPHLSAWSSMWSKNVTVITTHQIDVNSQKRLSALGIKMIHDEVIGLNHNDEGRLVSLSTQNGQQVDCDACWVALKWKAASDLAKSLCDVDENGLAKVDSNGKTSRAGVFAVGNAANAFAHLAHACAEGTNSGPHVLTYLLEARVTEGIAKMESSTVKTI